MSSHKRRPPGGLLQWRLWLSSLALVLLGALGGCATGPNAHPLDPFEPFNRSVFKFNEELDRAILKPVATAYHDAVPSMIRTGVSNFFGNLSDVWSFVNAVLQLKPQAAADNFLRVGVNTVFGFGGLLDFASAFNIDRHKEDFGQTLGRWGVRSGPYLMLPGLGPSTVRDTLALGVETGARADAVRRIPDVALRNSLYALRVVEARSELLKAGQMLEGAALDKYSFTRDVYLQLRRREVSDGKDEDAPEADEPPAAAPARATPTSALPMAPADAAAAVPAQAQAQAQAPEAALASPAGDALAVPPAAVSAPQQPAAPQAPAAAAALTPEPALSMPLEQQQAGLLRELHAALDTSAAK